MIKITIDALPICAWDKERAYQLVERLQATMPNSRIDWDDGIPENWISLIYNHERVAAMSIRVPILLLDSSISFSHESYTDILVIITRDWEEHCLDVDVPLVQRLADRWEITTHVDFQNLSAHELWWSTII